LFATALHLQAVSAAPVASNQTSTSDDGFLPPDSSNAAISMIATPFSDHGSSCYWWKVKSSDNKVALKINCDKIGKGLKIRASCIYGNTDWFTQTGTTYSTSYRDPSLPPMISPDAPLGFKLEYQPSGNTADMGTVYAQLVVEEHAIKNDWWTQLTLVDISPYLEVRGVLDLPGAINQYTSWISTPQQINTLSRQSWFGQPTARAEWQVRGQ
jgi:hypothetical protein